MHKEEAVKKDPTYGMGGSLKIDEDVDGWLKNNLDIDIH